MKAKSIHFQIEAYLDSKLRVYDTGNFAYSAYQPPNTMFSVANELPEILLELSPPTIQMYLRTLTLLKRNPNPILACSTIISAKLFADLFSERTYTRAKKDLIARGLLISTTAKSLVIVNTDFASKLYKPKLELE